MKRLAVAVFSIFLIVAFLGLCWVANSPAADTKKAPSTIQGLIETRAPVRRDFTLTCPWFGRVESKETIRVTALTDGEVLAIKVPDETPVTRGTLLFTLGGPRVKNRLNSLKSEIVALKTRVLVARQSVLEKGGCGAKDCKKRGPSFCKADLIHPSVKP